MASDLRLLARNNLFLRELTSREHAIDTVTIYILKIVIPAKAGIRNIIKTRPT